MTGGELVDEVLRRLDEQNNLIPADDAIAYSQVDNWATAGGGTSITRGVISSLGLTTTGLPPGIDTCFVITANGVDDRLVELPLSLTAALHQISAYVLGDSGGWSGGDISVNAGDFAGATDGTDVPITPVTTSWLRANRPITPVTGDLSGNLFVRAAAASPGSNGEIIYVTAVHAAKAARLLQWLPAFYTRDEAFTHLNEALMELALIAGHPTSEASIALTDSVHFQSLPSGAIALLHLANSSSRFLRKTTIEKIDRSNADWYRGATGTPQRWAPVGLYPNFFVDKRPTSVTLTGVTLDEPTTIAETTTIDLPDEYIEAIEEYVFHMLRFKEGGQEFALAMSAYDEFLHRAGHAEKRSMSEQYTLWAKEPAGDTGGGYSTSERS